MEDSMENYQRDIGRERVNPLTPMSDQDRIFPYNIKQTRKKYTINSGILSWSNTKFSQGTTYNCKADKKENFQWDLGRERVNRLWQAIWSSIVFCSVIITYLSEGVRSYNTSSVHQWPSFCLLSTFKEN